MSVRKKFKYIYGPVPSWRVGSSLGIDLLSQKEKICSFDCLYCQLGKSFILSDVRQLFVPEDEIIKELDALPETPIDYITISGRGEPTLADNLGNAISAIKACRKEPVAVITNSSLINKPDVRDELSKADLVIAKLDASSQESLILINQPHKGIKFEAIVEGLRNFRKQFKGKLALQIMFMENNKQYAEDMAFIADDIHPDEVQINTPLRPCGAAPLGVEELSRIKGFFGHFKTVSVYESNKKVVKPISDDDTIRRRGKY